MVGKTQRILNKLTKKPRPLKKLNDEFILPNYSGIADFNRKKINAFGEIWVKGNATADTVTTGSTTQVLRFANNGESNINTSDHTNDHITINKAGVYLVNVSVSFLGDPSVDWEFSVFTNNGTTECDNVHLNRKLGSGGDIGNAGAVGLCSFSVGDTVELWYEHGAGVNKDITIQDCNLNVVYVDK